MVRRTIDLFFWMYPTPSALLCADIKDVERLIDPVGLQETRRQAYQLAPDCSQAKTAPIHCCRHSFGADDGSLRRKAVLAMTRSFFAEVGCRSQLSA